MLSSFSELDNKTIRMIKILLSAIFFCFLAVTVPVSYGKCGLWLVGFGWFIVSSKLTHQNLTKKMFLHLPRYVDSTQFDYHSTGSADLSDQLVMS